MNSGTWGLSLSKTNGVGGESQEGAPAPPQLGARPSVALLL